MNGEENIIGLDRIDSLGVQVKILILKHKLVQCEEGRNSTVYDGGVVQWDTSKNHTV